MSSADVALRDCVVRPRPGWYSDPLAPGLLRYWDGASWTAHLAHRPRPPKPPHPTLPLRAAIGALLVMLSSLVASRLILDWLSRYDWSIPVYVALAGATGYGPVLVYCWLAGRRWGGESLRANSGLFARWPDAGWGPITWLCCLLAQGAIAIIVLAAGIPFTSNLEPIDDLQATRGYVIALLIVAVVAAPVVEEMVFRGVVLRGFLGVMPAVAAVALQAVLFGFAHFDPVRGAGNIGLVLVLSGAGAVLGGCSYLFRRIGPAIIAHAIINAIAMTIALTGVFQN